ncbi:MAG: isoaspartyl peptidase/L-asparaginase [Candidatus Aminicenantes bacterium]|nr:MAG: isoaspartyl peptidase/L-asparaginase [Candidatus Aminicenantes bacterium]
MQNKFSRRDFLKAGMGISAAAMLGEGKIARSKSNESGKMVVIASGNGLRTVYKAMEMLKNGDDPLDAVVAGVNIVEEDPDDMSVGYGGIPNEDMEVELDASVMHGPTHNAGAVAAMKHIKTPSKVAKLVMERSDHALLIGTGALKFAKAHGFKEENLLTDKARQRWLRWKERLSDRDDWFPPQEDLDEELQEALRNYGTINCCAVDANGDLAGVTTTSGLSYKIPGRVGDSPIIGAGLYVDNTVGAAGSTGRGEANILNCGSFTVVEFMRQGVSPEEACLRTLERIAETSKRQPHLLDEEGKPRFGLSFYAISKKGEYGSARMWSGGRFVLHDGTTSRKEEAAYLFKRKQRR